MGRLELRFIHHDPAGRQNPLSMTHAFEEQQQGSSGKQFAEERHLYPVTPAHPSATGADRGLQPVEPWVNPGGLETPRVEALMRYGDR
jgi:hypothetical protein